MSDQPSSSSMRTFWFMWAGQLVSVLGSRLSGFALSVWIYEQTGQVSMLALSEMSFAVPQVILSPLAGVLVDRINRRTAMLISDFGAGITVAIAAALFLSGSLEPWMVFPINFVMSAFNCIMWPAQSAAITQLVPKEHHGRASGLVQIGEAVSQVGGPFAAGQLYVAFGPGNMALIDAATYVVAIIAMLLLVRIPDAVESEEAKQSRGSFWTEMAFGWNYIVARPGLLSLLFYFAISNLVLGMIGPPFQAMALDLWSAEVMGTLGMIMGVGMLAGTLVMSAWGGTKRKINGLMIFGTIGGLFLMGAGLQPLIWLLAVCGFGLMFTFPIVTASSQAIWQSKVDPAVQGRVFSVRRTIAWSFSMIAPIVGATLVDNVLKPSMGAGGALAPIFGPLIGSGEVRGTGVLFILVGLITAVISAGALLLPRIRNVELELPDVIDNSTPAAEAIAAGPIQAEAGAAQA